MGLSETQEQQFYPMNVQEQVPFLQQDMQYMQQQKNNPNMQQQQRSNMQYGGNNNNEQQPRNLLGWAELQKF